MVIKYSDFAALLPLAPCSYEAAALRQVKQLIKPLKAHNYVKSVTIKNDWRGIGIHNVQIVFKFNDSF